MPKRSRPVLYLCSVLLGLGLAIVLGGLRRQRPNVILIVVDTLRADAISTVPGNSETPNIAELAAEGVLFSRAFAHAPMTLPAHAALFSGRHPFETGVYNNGQLIPAEMSLMAEQLQSAGYSTGAVVSLATLWPSEQHEGLDRGFDRFDMGDLEVCPAENTGERLLSALDRFGEDEPFFLFAHLSDPHEPYNEHRPWFDGTPRGAKARVSLDGEKLDMLSTSSMTFWETEFELGPGDHFFNIDGGPLFKVRALECSEEGIEFEPLWVSGELMTPTTHVQVKLPGAASHLRKVNVRVWLNDVPEQAELGPRYASEVRAADQAIGKLISELKVRGQWEDTIVILTADHGEALGEHGIVGHAVNLYDELLQVPLIIRLPGGWSQEQLELQAHGIARHVDVLPTLLDALDLSVSSEIAGHSLFTPGKRLLMAETHPPEAPRSLFAIRDESYKLILDAQEGTFEMYRLGPDPLELDNVYGHQGHLRESWELALRRLAEAVEPSTARDEATQRKLSALGY